MKRIHIEWKCFMLGVRAATGRDRPAASPTQSWLGTLTANCLNGFESILFGAVDQISICHKTPFSGYFCAGLSEIDLVALK